MKRSSKLIAVAFAATLAITGCGGGGGAAGGTSTPPATPHTAVSGIVFASDVFGYGGVNAYDFTGGSKGALLTSAPIYYTGAYLLSIPGTPGAILIEAGYGCYYDKGIVWSSNATGYPESSLAISAQVCTATPSLSAVVPFQVSVPLVVAVTPYTHAAVGLAEFEIRSGTATTTALIDANARLSQWVGTDILTTLPTEPVLSTTYNGASLYGALLSGIPSWLLDSATTAPAVLGTGTLTTLAFADAMKSDLEQDGVFNGIGRDATGSAVALSVGNAALTTTIYRHELAFNAMIRVRAETEGALHATLAEQAAIVGFLPALTTYNGSVNSLVDGSAVVPLAGVGPVVWIGAPLPGSTLTWNDGMAGIVRDDAGIPSGNTVMLIDGVQYTSFFDQYIPNNFINTTIFPNGSHILTIQATDNLGRVSSASVTVKFFN